MPPLAWPSFVPARRRACPPLPICLLTAGAAGGARGVGDGDGRPLHGARAGRPGGGLVPLLAAPPLPLATGLSFFLRGVVAVAAVGAVQAVRAVQEWAQWAVRIGLMGRRQHTIVGWDGLGLESGSGRLGKIVPSRASASRDV
jgi:hypothetical protein